MVKNRISLKSFSREIANPEILEQLFAHQIVHKAHTAEHYSPVTSPVVCETFYLTTQRINCGAAINFGYPVYSVIRACCLIATSGIPAG